MRLNMTILCVCQKIGNLDLKTNLIENFENKIFPVKVFTKNDFFFYKLLLLLLLFCEFYNENNMQLFLHSKINMA